MEFLFKDKSSKFKKYSTTIGSFIVLLFTDCPTFWGNWSTYVCSYLSRQKASSNEELSAPWVLSIFIMSVSLGVILSGSVKHRINSRVLVSVSLLLTNAGIMVSYFSVQSSLPALVVTFGGLFGFGVGITNIAVFDYLLGWSESDTGFLLSFALCGGNLGSIFSNVLITLYINPRNLSPNVHSDTIDYFYQKEIIDKVPGSFLMYGILSACSQFIGYCLLFSNPDRENHSSVDSYGSALSDPIPCEPQTVDTQTHSSSNTFTSNNVDTQISDTSPDNSIYTPRQLLSSVVFYAVWLAFMGGETSYVMVGNYYKVYGQKWIADDHFLSDIGTITCVVATATRLVWATVIDRLGAKRGLLGIFTSLPLLFLFLYFAAMVDRWLYLAVNVLIGCVHSCVHPTLISSVVTYFGKKHFSGNLSVFFIAVMASNLCFPPLFNALLVMYGWFSLFVFTACALITALITCVIVLP